MKPTLNRLEWKENGYLTWEWEGHKINYIDEGERDKPALLLIHGFGASAYHWRYNVPALAAKGYRVLALDLLGFGLSDKPILDYSAELWRDQVCAFVKEVIGQEREVVVMGNSLGGYTALSAASFLPENIKGCVLLNAAGRFRDLEAEAKVEEMKNAPPKSSMEKVWDDAVEGVSAAIQRGVITASFYYTKQPLRIKQVLNQVYINPANVDEELVDSIRYPALDPNAPEALYPPATRVSIQAGHCPHDEAPEEVNRSMLTWLQSIGY